MSGNSTTTSAYGDLSSFNFTGGFPTTKDLAPSIVFLVVYVALTPVLIWRLINRSHRDRILIRPAIFLACRIGMLVLRAIMSKNTYGEGELIGELVLVSIGYLFLMEPVVECWRRHVATAVSKDEAPRWVTLLSRILKIALLGAIITAAVGAGQISGAISDPSKISTVVTLRKVSAILSFAVSIITLLAILLTHFEFKLDARRTAYLIPLTLLLAVVSVYRIVQIYSKDASSGIRKPVAFWLMQMLCELLVFAALLAISIPVWFPRTQEQEEKNERDIEMGRAHPVSSVSK